MRYIQSVRWALLAYCITRWGCPEHRAASHGNPYVFGVIGKIEFQNNNLFPTQLMEMQRTCFCFLKLGQWLLQSKTTKWALQQWTRLHTLDMIPASGICLISRQISILWTIMEALLLSLHVPVAARPDRAGADVNRPISHGSTLLMNLNGHSTCVRMLIVAGADVTLKNDFSSGFRVPKTC